MSREVLLAGYTDFVTDEFLLRAFPNCHIMIMGQPFVESSVSDKITVMNQKLTSDLCEELFNIYEFEDVVYFSESIRPFGFSQGDEFNLIQALLENLNESSHLLCVTGKSYRTNKFEEVFFEGIKELCHSINYRTGGISILQSPWVYTIEEVQKEFKNLFAGKEVTIPFSYQQNVSFVASEDLALLIYRMMYSFERTIEPYTIPDKYMIRLDQLIEKIAHLSKHENYKVNFADEIELAIEPSDNLVLRKKFMWFPVYSIIEDLPLMYQRFVVSQEKEMSWLEKAIATFESSHLLLRAVELLVAFFFTELLLKLTGITVQFDQVDFRLAYIMIMGIMYDMPTGLAAAGLESISLLFAYSRLGMSWINIFYDPANWLVFITYFTVGALCGYIRSKDLETIEFKEKDNESLMGRLDYLNTVVNDVLQDKKDYKQQILSSKDSFGKIFTVVRQLETVEPDQIMVQACDILENILSNHTVSIYSLSGYGYGRLQVSSKGTKYPYSIPTESIYQKLKEVEEGEVWVNKEMKDDSPFYMFGVYQNHQLISVIQLHSVTHSQMSLYYTNLFKIIGSLISSSLVRAKEYQELVIREQCVPATVSILNQTYFLKTLENVNELAEKKLADHLLIEIKDNSYSLTELDLKIRQCVRATDSIGMCGGKLYVILRQAMLSQLSYIEPRFKSQDLAFRVLSAEEENELLEKGKK